jgi:hypothetical protein
MLDAAFLENDSYVAGIPQQFDALRRIARKADDIRLLASLQRSDAMIDRVRSRRMQRADGYRRKRSQPAFD